MEFDSGAAAVVAASVLLWTLVSQRLERTNISAPIAFVCLGLILSHEPVDIIHLNLESSGARSLAEVALALVLFSDASRVNVRALRSDVGRPARLLTIGLPLTIGAGTVAAAGLLPGTTWWVAATIGAIVAPTDAALGAQVIQDERLPVGVRRLLNVESGLNDGIAAPFVNLFLAGSLAAESLHTAGVGHALLDLIAGAAIGLGVGLFGGKLLAVAARHNWSAQAFRPLGVLALALFAYSIALEAGGNGFVAAFVAGMGFGAVMPIENELTLGFTEDFGELLTLLVWFIFGVSMLVPGLEQARWEDVVFALAALTVVRMAPVAVALIGSGLDRASVAFIGWFGPRGLASVVFGLIAVDALEPAEGHRVLAAVTTTVALSVVAHGVTASPLIERYVRSESGHRDGGHGEKKPTLRVRSLSGDRRRFAVSGSPGE